jgi:hypothetical protein
VALAQIGERDNAFAESWLQQLLYQHPSILPVEALDESYYPLISIGREIAQIDNLFISPNGSLTLVETKLWRNPEAHRTVIAQILDYVNTLSTWSYSTLDQYVSAYFNKTHGRSTNLFNLVKSSGHSFDISEIEFQSKVQECLRNGRFALLIVGDKIFPEATQLADLIQSAPHMQYTFGFVELRCYRLEKDSAWPLIVVPHFVAKTKEFTRAVIRVIYEEKKPEVQIEAIEQQRIERPAKIDSSIFKSSLPGNIRDRFASYLDRWVNEGYEMHWGTVGFSFYVQWKGKAERLFDALPYTMGMVTEKKALAIGIPPNIYSEYRGKLMNSPKLSGLVVQNRTYQNYVDLETDDVFLLLDATDKMAHELTQMDNQN